MSFTANGIWTEWSQLTKCSPGVSGCREGITYVRNRTCTNPPPYLGGDYCAGNDTQAITQGIICSYKICDCIYF